MKPLVSVVIPVYNGAAYIKQAIDSVLLQDMPVELIIIDDGSTDNLLQVIAPYIERQQVRLIRNESNMGVAKSRNRGVKEALGEYIAFLDGDDWWAEGKLTKQLKLMSETGCVICSTGRRLVDVDGKDTGRSIGVKEELTYRDMLFQNHINCSSVLIKRSVALEFPMGHDECHEDYITWLRVLEKYKKACAVNEPLLYYRVSDKGKSGSKLKSAGMTYKVYRHMGFGYIKSGICFLGYAVNGVLKYYIKRK